MTWLIATSGGSDAGVGIGVHGWHSPAGVGRITVLVLPSARGRGVGSELLARLGAWLRDHGCAEATAAVFETDGASLAWAERRGFTEVGRNSILALDLLAADVAEVRPPAGVEIVSWADRPDLTQGLYEVYLEASPDVPGEEEAEISSFEEWLANDMQGPSDRPEATFVAVADGFVVGFAKLSIPTVAGDVAWHDLTGVRRAWRGRGVAAALKLAQIAWAKTNGFQRLQTFNEERNEPIRRLNQRHGYQLQPGLVTMRGPLAEATRPGVDKVPPSADPVESTRIHLVNSTPALERALDLPLGVPVGDVAALVLPLLAAGQRELDLDAALLEVEPRRNQRQTLLAHLAPEIVDLVAMQEQLAVALGRMRPDRALRVVGDRGADEPDLVAPHVGVRVADLDVAVTQRLDLRAGEHETRLDTVEQLVVVPGTAVVGNQLGSGRLRHRRKCTEQPARPPPSVSGANAAVADRDERRGRHATPHRHARQPTRTRP